MGKLTDTQIRSIKPRANGKPIRVSDGGGLYLEVREKGNPYWRMGYRFNGKQKVLAFGTYPTVSLKRAREEAKAAHDKLDRNIDPSVKAQIENAAPAPTATFEQAARDWQRVRLPSWGKRYADRVNAFIERDLVTLAPLPVADVTAAQVLEALRRVEARGALHQAAKLKGVTRDILAHAVACGLRTDNPAAAMSATVLMAKPTRHHAAITDPQQFGTLLRAIRGYHNPVVRIALEMLAMTFTRPGELRLATWAEIELEDCQWSIPAARMKMRQAHVVPLSRQAVERLTELRYITQKEKYAFAGLRSGRPISDGTLTSALRGMGYAATVHQPHGFRASAHTLLDEKLRERPDLIEHQLSHAVRDPLGRAYNRASHLPERRLMMQRWSDYLDELVAKQ